MPWQPLPITGPPHKNLSDERELDVRSAQVVDAIVDEAGHTVKRPGLLEFVDTGVANGIDGLYWWDEQGAAIAVVNQRVFKITDSTGTIAELTGSSALLAGNRVSFDTDGTTLLMTNGGAMVHTAIGGPLTTMADAEAPTTVDGVVIHDQYAIAIVKDSASFQFSEVGSLTSWRSQDVATAEAKPDRTLAVLSNSDGFILFGARSTEFWIDDGVSPFSRVRGLTFDRGCGAKYSPALLGDTWLWIDERRRVIRATTNSIKEVSDAIDQDLQSLSSVSDAIGDIMTVHGWPLYVLTFPLANKTYVYDLKREFWTEWGNWDSGSATYLRFRGNSYCYAKAWNYHLVGDRSNGKIYRFERGTYQDNATTLRSLRRTGFITHGTSNLKRCKRIRLRLKRGTATGPVPNPTMVVRWRERGDTWSNAHTANVTLGAVGVHDLYVDIRQCGTYRARQYEFYHADATDWILMGGEEEFEVTNR